MGAVISVVLRFLGLTGTPADVADDGHPIALSSTEYLEFPLVKRTEISHNTRLFRFKLPTDEHKLGLPIGKHIFTNFKGEDGKDVSRPYTPTSSDDDLGFFELLIKVYPNGKMSTHIDQLKIGDTLRVKGPRGKFQYKKGMVKAFGMIAGGTGITPMLQIINAIMKDETDDTKVALIFANVTEDDILLREELDELAAKHANFTVHYTLDKPSADWKFSKGFVTKEMIEEHLPSSDEDSQILLCGPRPMVEFMGKHLDTLGFSEEQRFKF